MSSSSRYLVLGVVKSHLFAGGFFEGRDLVHGYSRSSFQWVCVTAKYEVSESTGGLRFFRVLVAACDSAHHSHLPPATFCKSDVYHISASVWNVVTTSSQFLRSKYY